MDQRKPQASSSQRPSHRETDKIQKEQNKNTNQQNCKPNNQISINKAILPIKL